MPEEDPQAKSPAARLLGREALERDAQARTAVVRFQASPDFRNRRGTIQGGILAAMLDSVFGTTLASSLQRGESIVTLEMKISFIRPAVPGTIIGNGRVVERGRSIAFLEGELRDADGALLATGTSTFRIARERRTEER
jgi:uncharacterized protein (TIGR00369 family)